MTTDSTTRLYDEDSVFNRIFSEDKAKAEPSKGERLRALFADAQAPTETLDVKDFLPSY